MQAQGGKTLKDFELPIPAQLATPGDTVISEEWAKYNVTRQAQQLARDVPLLNQHQHSIYVNVIDVVRDPRPVDKTFFVDGAGGAGKTFLYWCLLSKVRCTSDITLSMASSGIVALLLEGSCIAHSRFKIPIASLLWLLCLLCSPKQFTSGLDSSCTLHCVGWGTHGPQACV